MSSTQVQRPLKVESSADKSVSRSSKDQEKPYQRRFTFSCGATGPKKNKHDNDGRFKFTRKRAQSFSTGTGKFFPPYKRRKKGGIIPPTKFLLGGNIYDPLNLNSLQDEEINRAMNAVTPKSSPLPTPKHRKGEVEVIIPPNINDPLNLINCEDNEKYEKQLISPTKKNRKSRNRKRKRKSSGELTKDESVEVPNAQEGAQTSLVERTNTNPSAQTVECDKVKEVRQIIHFVTKDKEKKFLKPTEDTKDQKHEKRGRKLDLKDKIVSPVIPQPGTWKRQPGTWKRHPHGYRKGGNVPRNFTHHTRHWQENIVMANQTEKSPVFEPKNDRFQHGNYVRKYGTWNHPINEEERLKCFNCNIGLFRNKVVLDIGCNVGHITIRVARDFGPKKIVGLDIDGKLIEMACRNIKNYTMPFYTELPSDGGEARAWRFPISMPLVYGDVNIPYLDSSPYALRKFPNNVSFVQGNYVLDSDLELQNERMQFDTILCLNVTKWIHLNYGDAGLKRAFKRMYAQLNFGGTLILQIQSWESYRRKQMMSESIFNACRTIDFCPSLFIPYLLSEVGFIEHKIIGSAFNKRRGFYRPIVVLTKGVISPMRLSISNTPSHFATTGYTDRFSSYAAPSSTEISAGPVYPSLGLYGNTSPAVRPMARSPSLPISTDWKATSVNAKKESTVTSYVYGGPHGVGQAIKPFTRMPTCRMNDVSSDTRVAARSYPYYAGSSRDPFALPSYYGTGYVSPVRRREVTATVTSLDAGKEGILPPSYQPFAITPQSGIGHGSPVHKEEVTATVTSLVASGKGSLSPTYVTARFEPYSLPSSSGIEHRSCSHTEEVTSHALDAGEKGIPSHGQTSTFEAHPLLLDIGALCGDRAYAKKVTSAVTTIALDGGVNGMSPKQKQTYEPSRLLLNVGVGCESSVHVKEETSTVTFHVPDGVEKDILSPKQSVTTFELHSLPPVDSSCSKIASTIISCDADEGSSDQKETDSTYKMEESIPVHTEKDETATMIGKGDAEIGTLKQTPPSFTPLSCSGVKDSSDMKELTSTMASCDAGKDSSVAQRETAQAFEPFNLLSDIGIDLANAEYSKGVTDALKSHDAGEASNVAVKDTAQAFKSFTLISSGKVHDDIVAHVKEEVPPLVTDTDEDGIDIQKQTDTPTVPTNTFCGTKGCAEECLDDSDSMDTTS